MSFRWSHLRLTSFILNNTRDAVAAQMASETSLRTLGGKSKTEDPCVQGKRGEDGGI